jgi:hypothetical protein
LPLGLILHSRFSTRLFKNKICYFLPSTSQISALTLILTR